MTLAEHVRVLMAQGVNKQSIANQLGITRPRVQRIARKLAAAPRNEALEALGLADTTMRVNGNDAECEVRVPRFIATEADAIAASHVDVTVWDVVGMEVRHYAMATKDGPIQASYVKLRMRRKTVANSPERVADAIVKGITAALRPFPAWPSPRARSLPRPRILRTRIITDLHFGGYAWDKSTGSENWDIATASSTAFAANRYLDARVPEHATDTLIAMMGDLAHYDTPKGTTTGGTQLDLDSRVDLMLAALSEYCVTTVAEEAEQRPTRVMVLSGNHDDIVCRAIRRMLLLVFKTHKNVTVMEQYTKRQYHRFGNTLLGFTHGDGNRQRHVDAMAHECGKLGLWDGATCREFHMGHIHTETEKQKTLWGAESLHGTVVRTHMALVPTDSYHSDEGWVGSQRGVQDFYYHEKGALIGTVAAIPRVLEAA